MPPSTLLIALPLSLSMSLALSACARHIGSTTEADEDGVSCAMTDHGNKVFIEVAYDGNGRPSVTPDDCTVDNGTEIVWRTGKDVNVAFDIDFDGPSPAGRDAPRLTRSNTSNGRQKVKLVAANQAARYKYAIQANGQRVDPAIIIRPGAGGGG